MEKNFLLSNFSSEILEKCAMIKLLLQLITNIYNKIYFSLGLYSQIITTALTKKTVILKASIFSCQMCVSGTQTRLGVPLTHMWNGRKIVTRSPHAEALKPVG